MQVGNTVNWVLAAEDQFSGAFSKLRKEFESSETASDKLRVVMAGVGAAAAALGVTAAAVSFANSVSEAIKFTASLQDIKEKTGASTDALQKIAPAAAIAGVSFESVEQAITIMSKNMAGADDKSKGLGQALAALGLSARDSNGKMKDAATLYVEIATEMGKYEDGATKVGIAMAAMGKQGAEQNKVFAAMAEAQKYVVIATEEQVEAADRYQDNLVKLNLASSATAKILGNEVAPVLADFTDAMLEAMTGSGGLTGELKKLAAEGKIKEWAQEAALWIANVIDVFDALVRVAQIVWKALATGVEQTVEMFTGIGTAMKKALEGDFSGAAAAAKSSFDKIKASGQQFATDFDAIAGKTQFSAILKAKFAEVDTASGKTKKSNDDLNAAFQKGSDESQKYADQMDKLLQSIQDGNDKLRLEGEAIGKTRLERELANLQLEREKALRQDSRKLIQDQINALFDQREAQLRANDATREAEEAQKRLMKAYQDATKEAQKEADAAQKLRDGVIQQSEALENQIKTWGMTTEQLRLYNIEEQRKIALSKASTVADVELIEREYERQKALAGTITGLEANAEATKRWQETLDGINQAGYDLFQSMAQGFNGVKDWAKNAGDAIKKFFLSVLYEATLKPFVVRIVTSIAGGVSGNAVAGGLNGGGSILDMFGGNGSGMLGELGDLLGFGGGFGNMAESLGSLLGFDAAGSTAFSIGATSPLTAIADLLGFGDLGLGAAGLGLPSMLGAAIPIAGLAAMVIPMVMKFFDEGPAMRTGTFASGAASAGGDPMFASSSKFGNFGIVNDKWFSEADMGKSVKDFLAGITSIDNALSKIIGADLTGKVKTALEGVATEFSAGMEHEAVTFGSIMKERYVAVFDVLDVRLGTVVEKFEGTGEELGKFLTTLADVYVMVEKLPDDVGNTLLDVLASGILTVDEIGRFATAYVGLSQLLDTNPVDIALDSVSAAATTNYSRVMDLRSGLTDLVDSYDGSVDSTEQLYAATLNYVQAQVQALTEIEKMRVSLSDMFGEAHNTLEQFFWTNQQKADKLMADANEYQALLNKTLDPTLIDKYAKLIKDDLMQAFQLLSPEQQKAQQAGFLQRIDEADALVKARLDASRDSITQSGKDQMSIMSAIRDALNAAAASMVQAANAMTNAANTQAAAANTQLVAAQQPVTVDVNSTITVDYSGGTGP